MTRFLEASGPMAQLVRDRILRRLLRAEGYLELDLPGPALEILQNHDDWATMRFEASHLRGEALRALGRHREALKSLEVAAALRPGHVAVSIALGWCYKRTHRLAQAIDSLERACREHPEVALLHYNLACYWSLAGNLRRALSELRSALELDPRYAGRVGGEPDFDPIRHFPEFEALTGRRATLS